MVIVEFIYTWCKSTSHSCYQLTVKPRQPRRLQSELGYQGAFKLGVMSAGSVGCPCNYVHM